MSSQLDLYQQVILEHNRRPKNFCRLENPDYSSEGYNPLCGDHLWVDLDVDDAGIVTRCAFDGTGCAICKASASIMTCELTGKTVAEVREIFENFQLLLKGETNHGNLSKKLLVFSSVSRYPSRVKCAGLAWHTVKGALEKSKEPAKTE
ncbi:MAG: Fe-S cluster assembly sulfur transfer protein SufU [Oligoflexales bacterium]